MVVFGCTLTREIQIQPQSHFTSPNANVEPIGTVTGEASSTGLLPNLSARVVEAAYRSALSKKGGDTLINIKFQRRVSYIPLVFIQIYTTTVTVEGTAAKMSVGKQEIGLLQREQIRTLVSQAPGLDVHATGKESAR